MECTVDIGKTRCSWRGVRFCCHCCDTPFPGVGCLSGKGKTHKIHFSSSENFKLVSSFLDRRTIPRYSCRGQCKVPFGKNHARLSTMNLLMSSASGERPCLSAPVMRNRNTTAIIWCHHHGHWSILFDADKSFNSLWVLPMSGDSNDDKALLDSRLTGSEVSLLKRFRILKVFPVQIQSSVLLGILLLFTSPKWSELLAKARKSISQFPSLLGCPSL